MNDAEIDILKDALKKYPNDVIFIHPYTGLVHTVLQIGLHQEEGNEPCAIFKHGKCAVLYNCELNSFHITTPLK